LYTGDLPLASRLAQKLLVGNKGGIPSSTFEIEASCVDLWSSYVSAQTMSDMSELQQLSKGIERTYKGQMDQADIDMLMLWAKCKLALKQTAETLNIYNQVIV
jgi:hypothetical protein